VFFLEDGGEVLVHEVLECDWGWHPAFTVDTAVEPVLVAVGSAGGSRFGNAIGITALASGSNDDCTTCAWGSSRAGRLRCGLFRGSARGSGFFARGAACRLGDSDVFGDGGGGGSGGTVTRGGGLFRARVRGEGGVLGHGAGTAIAVSCCEVHFAADTTAVRAGWEDFEMLIVGRSGSGRETGCDEGECDRSKSREMHF